ncbi:EAL and HDOD domain-containing protein [Iodobacter fluviatilis]|uniref:EAL and modified HD-GYP domain-containing signal transduction protein n=1 Tax=Iodobacter fluviatilis TaxID=537 RepID=A0A377SUP7_9NEIS|nr:HDOD domain-containing protein [Iodobacter fluviatilis]TCU85524.1 EAL and modified HD-GYP domain-containing signal transduction protein [Iodobacter fluviatilis]STR45028.1 HDOD domain [Iodobacter fluviatilis]
MFKFLQQLFSKPAPPPPPVNPTHQGPAITLQLQHVNIIDQSGKIVGSLLRRRAQNKESLAQILLEEGELIRHAVRLGTTMSKKRLRLLEISAGSLLQPELAQLAAQGNMLLLNTNTALPDRGLSALQKLQKAGLGLALQLPATWSSEIVAQAQWLAFSVNGKLAPDIERLARRIHVQGLEKPMLMLDLAWHDEFQLCQQLNIAYAAGRLFHQSTWQEGPVEAGFLRIMDLLNLLRQDASNSEIAVSLKTDPLLSFRVLAQANSAAEARNKKIDTLDQALVAIGRERLYRWLSLLLFSLPGQEKPNPGLLEYALLRAELTERLGSQRWPQEKDHLYLLGLFSVLEQLIHRPLSQIVGLLKLPEAVCAALLHGTGPYAPFLNLAIASESAQCPDAKLLVACGINANHYFKVYYEALLSVEAASEEA